MAHTSEKERKTMNAIILYLIWIFLPLTLSSLCYPLESKRAYVTSYLGTSDNLLKIQVLKKSLDRTNSKVDLVILMPQRFHTSEIEQEFASHPHNGYKIHLIQEKLIHQIHDSELREILPLWSFELSQYDRVIYLDPYTIAIRNVDNMFSCSGYCASRYSKDGPIVLHPLKDTHAYLLQLVSSGKTQILSELSQFYNLDHCPTFIEDIDQGKVCTESDYRSISQATCHQLPLSFAVPSSHFTTSSFTNELICSDCGFDKVRLIVYPENEPSYEAFLFTEKAIHYRWQAVRSRLPFSSRDIFSACISFFIAILLICGMLWSHRRGTIIATIAPSTETTSPSPKSGERGERGGGRGEGEEGEGGLSDSEMGHEPPPPSSIAGLRITSAPTVKLLCQGIGVTILVSLWYHLSLIISKCVLSFLWEPNVSLAVSFIWSNVTLFTGLQLIDYTYLMLQYAPKLYLLEGSAFLTLFWILGILLHTPDKPLIIMPIAVASLSMSLNFAYLSRFGSMKEKWFVKKFGQPVSSVTSYCGPLVTKEDISLLLVLSLMYYVIAMTSILLNFPDSLRSLILRCVTMIHATAVICLFLSIIYGQNTSTSGDTTVMLQFKGFNPFDPFNRQNLSNLVTTCNPFYFLFSCLCRILRHPFLLLLTIILIAFTTVYYILFISHQATLPSTSPYFCLKQKGVYINPNGGISPMCGAAEAMSLYDTGVYSETFAQHYICLEAAPSHREIMKSSISDSTSLFPDSSLVLTGLSSQNKRKFLTFHRTTTSTCSSVSQFFFTNVLPTQLEDGLGYCIYNPFHGIFLSSRVDGEVSCQRTEMWHVEPSHRWTYIWGSVGQLTSPLRYDFTHQHPVISLLFLGLLIFFLKRIPVTLNKRASIAIILLTLGIFIVHLILLKLIWGSVSYVEFRNQLTAMISATISRLGLPNGPQFLRLVSTTPEQCPETVWLISLVFLTSDFITLIAFLWFGIFQYSMTRSVEFSQQSSTKPRTDLNLHDIHKQKSLSDLVERDPPSPRRLRQVSSISNISDYVSNHIDPDLEFIEISEHPPHLHHHQPFSATSASSSSTLSSSSAAIPPLSSSELTNLEDNSSSSSLKDRFSSKYSVSSVIVGYVISALVLDAIISLIVPIQALGAHPSSKSSCLYYEKRFHLLGYEKEYVDTVVIISFILFHCSWKYIKWNFFRILGMGLAFITWILVWLTVDSAYIILAMKFLIFYLTWQSLLPRSLPLISRIVNDNEGREVVI